MARPRVFISSTFYDLKQIRADLEFFIRGLGYEPVMHEKGQVPYGKDKKLEASCYAEIQRTDMVISIIGGRFGSASQQSTPYSITQTELKTAIEAGKQVFIFIERSVHAEYFTYQKNKDLKGMRFSHVDNPAVYQFIEEILALPQNNATTAFDGVSEIIDYLREQWAGLFQRFLQDQERVEEQSVIKSLQSTASTLQDLVTYFNKTEADKSDALKDLLLTAHPAFDRLGKLLQVGYRVFFTTTAELSSWLKSRSYIPITRDHWDKPDFAEWSHTEGDRFQLLKVSTRLFEKDGRLKGMAPSDWKDSYITLENRENSVGITDEDIPF